MARLVPLGSDPKHSVTEAGEVKGNRAQESQGKAAGQPGAADQDVQDRAASADYGKLTGAHTARTLKVAAVQMASENGQILANLDRATPLVEAAAKKGAALILLPELMSTGYTFSRSIWAAGEPKDGPTVTWLKETSQRLGVWIGTTFLEAEGEHFFNTFVLTNPDGEIAGRVRKQQPALWEAYLYKGEVGSHVIDTELGRVAVGICYENQLALLPEELQTQEVDLVLMPHSAPSPAPGPLFSLAAIKSYEDDLQKRAERMANLLGVPVVLVNKSGVTKTPLPGTISPPAMLTFPGRSTIVDSDGQEKAQAGTETAVLVEEVHLDPAKKVHKGPVAEGRWAFRVPKWSVAAHVIELMGGLSYSMSRERKQRALEASSQSP